jgi:hypothetical protein
MRADTLREQVGGGWALEIWKWSFLGPVKQNRSTKEEVYQLQRVAAESKIF